MFGMLGVSGGVGSSALPEEVAGLGVRWVVDRGHGWLEVPLSEAVTASLEVRPVSQFSYVNRDVGLAYLVEDCDAGIWFEWVAGSDDGEAVRAVALGVKGFHRCDGPAWVRDLPRFSVLESDPRAGGRVTPADIPGVLS